MKFNADGTLDFSEMQAHCEQRHDEMAALEEDTRQDDPEKHKAFWTEDEGMSDEEYAAYVDEMQQDAANA